MPRAARKPARRPARPAAAAALRRMRKIALVEEAERLRRALRRQAARGPKDAAGERPPDTAAAPGPVRLTLDHYLDLFDFAPVMYLLLDEYGLVVHANLAGCWMLEVDRAHVIGHPLLTRIVAEDRRAFLEHMRRCRTQGGVIESHLRLQRPQGPLTCRFYSKRARFGGRSIFPTITTDLAEQMRLEQERLQALLDRDRAERDRRVARASVAAKDRLLAMVSHELRTPLTPALIAATRLVREGGLTEHARRLAATVRRNIEMEARLIDDLLDITRLARGGLELHRRTVDVHRVLQDAVAVCTPGAESKGVALAMDLEAARHHASADEARLRQVFWNLLQNAITFTEAGGSVRVRTANTAADILRVSVSDSGAGMDADALAGLFSPFEPDAMARRDSRGGLGLGLTICKGIVDAHGGHIWAMSDGTGHGSTFELELPAFRARAESLVEQPHEAPAHTADGRCRVLLIEDDADTSAMLRMFLEQEDCEVEVAPSLARGLARLREGWDAVVSDIGLPDGSGLQVAEHAADLPQRPRMIALSGYGSPAHVAASREAGFDDHLVKPIDLTRLVETLKGGEGVRS